METAAAAAPASFVVAGPSSEASTPAAYDDDHNARHFAITASQVPKPAGSMIPALSPPGADVGSMKDVKSIGTRFHEDCHETDSPSPRLRSSRMFKGKGKEAVSIAQERKKPLRLLHLPVDILKDIVKEVTHTNDLTSLALCHSALHRLTIPHIYSRFDIVWPDTSVHAEPRSGVDALTYGLATLVMAEEIFGEAPGQRREQSNRYTKSGQGRATETAVRRRRGNHYAQFTRKFSLGNGPPDWVQEYLISKEGGKMLGTLVALAVARMQSLETFIWDMPTGILRDVWLALSSLGDRDDGRPCRLEKLWVRWHDSSSADATVAPPAHVNIHTAPLPALLSPTPLLGSPAMPPHIHLAAFDRVEHPSFSILPPLKSLSVLDIDELAYLDEMAVLIGRSLDKLRELRVGIARHAMTRDWVTVWEGDNLQQVDPHYPTAGSLTIGKKRLGGVLGTLTGFVCDMRRPRIVVPDRTRRRSPPPPPAVPTGATERKVSIAPPVEVQDTMEAQSPTIFDLVTHNAAPSEPTTSLRDIIPEHPSDIASSPESWPPPHGLLSPTDIALGDDPLVATSRQASPEPTHAVPFIAPPADSVPLEHERDAGPPLATLVDSFDLPAPPPLYLANMLHLESLELERVPLSVPVLQKAIDWTHLTSLTLLHCQNHEQLWKTLRRTFAPLPKSPTYPHARRTPNSTPRKNGKMSVSGSGLEMVYPLKLRKVHTNTVSPALISFLKETLAPNSLETLFLQEARSYNSSVNVDTIFRGPLRRHRNSLKKVLIDSSEKGADGVPINSARWRRWMLSREILAFVCGGKMPALRELGGALDYRDWVRHLTH